MRILWDKYEAAFLLDKLIDVLEGKIPRKVAVEDISKKLRAYAVNRGLTIDDVYRNTNGIDLKMRSIEYMHTGGKSGINGKSKLFQEIADTYKNDRKLYNAILKEAKEKIETKNSNRDNFFAWLSKKISSAQLSEYYICYADIDYFCFQENLSDKRLFEITDANIVNYLTDIVLKSKKFRNSYRHSQGKITAAMNLYCDFLKEIYGVPEPETYRPMKMLPVIPKRIPQVEVQTISDDKKNISQVEVKVVPADKKENVSPNEKEITLNRQKFLSWLKANNVAWRSQLDYVFEIGQLTKIANRSKIDDANLFLITDIDRLRRIKKLSVATTSFRAMPDKHQTTMSAAIDKLIEFRGGVSETVTENIPVKVEVNSAEKYAAILNKYFGENGYQTGRAIYLNRFKNYFKSEYGEFPAESDKQIDDTLQKVGTLRDGRIFPKQDDNQNQLIDDIVADIIGAFEQGVSAVYIEAVYEKYRQQLADNLKIYNVDALTPLLKANAQGKFLQSHSHFKIQGRVANPVEDVLNILKESHQPLSYDDIHKKLWYIPYDKLKQFIFKDKSIAYVSQDKYFYAPNLPIDDKEQQQLIALIKSEINFHGYITDSKLMNLIQNKYPIIAMNLEGFSVYGVRNCLAYIFRDYFAFKGNVISTFGEELNIKNIFADICQEYEQISLEELKSLANDLNGGIMHWDAVLGEMIRVSQNLFVRKDLIDFDVEKIDDVLDEMCPQDYIPLQELNLFLSFPHIGYAWNGYVIESYLSGYSRKFNLIRNSFSENGFFGAMVRKDSAITDYYSLIVDALSHSDALTSTAQALQFMVSQGYQQRKTYKDIEKALRDAKLRKEHREQQEN